jgi:RHS repeat-associated protein
MPTAVVQTDPTGKVTTNLLDATGRTAKVQQVISGRTLSSTYAYDAKGNLITFVDAIGNSVRSWYDSFGRVLRVQRPEQDMINVLDPAGNAVEARTPAGSLVTRTYDGCNRPVSVLEPGKATPVIRFTYHDTGAAPPPDAGQHTVGGRCARVDDESGSTVFDYDARGRPALKRSQPTGSAVAYTLSMARRADGNIDTMTYPGAASGPLQIVMHYNKRGLLSAIPGLISSVEYDLEGRRTKATFANSSVSIYAYDNVGHPTMVNHTGPGGSFYAAQLVWDLAGNLTRRVSPDQNLATTYQYDDLHRLTRATTDAGEATSCTYDDAGNLTSKSDVGAYAYGQNGAPKTCLTSAGADAFSYTPLGQMAQTPWGTQSFDPLGRLASIAGAVTASFRYDYTGARAAATITSGGTTNTRLTPDPLYAIENGTLVRYLFDGQRAVARDVDGGGRTWLHEDHVGSLVTLTDATGTVTDAIRYDAFGAVVARSAAGSNIAVGFGTGTLDNATGLLYLQARYYHPRYGRFISPDPIVQDVFDPIAWNSYAYCRNNPQSFVDPTGREWWKILVGALAVVALVALAVVTFGAATPLSVGLGVAIIAGVVAGGVIGGVSAGLAGGSFGDILLGALVGAAVGGWAAFGGAAIVGALGINAGAGWASALAAGAIEGAVNGAAMGFASAFAGGNTTLDKLLEQTAIGALVGAVVGGALGIATYAITTAPPSDPTQGLQKWTQPNVPSGPSGPSLPPSSVPQPPAGTISDFGQAASTVASKAAGQVLSPAAMRLAQIALASPFQAAITTLVTDAASGLWTMGYLPKLLEEGLQKIGVQSASGKF